jgi:tRNA(Ile)-lysidine synthase
VLESFIEVLRERFAVGRNQRLLLALSGGADSVALAYLLKEGGFSFALAHCNFQLRGKESEGDERFCKRLAAKLQVTLYTQRFSVTTQTESTGQSIQMAAREMRYRWFAELIQNEKIEFLLTAHHGNDVSETVLLNLVRGTGIQGLKGIPATTGRILRPLLGFTKQELLIYLKSKRLSYREDSSNESLKYDRNVIRKKVMPVLENLNPGFAATMRENVARFTEEADIVNDYLVSRTAQVMKRQGEEIFISKAEILKEKYAATLVNHLLRPFGFKAAMQSDVLRSVQAAAQAGRLFFSPTHQLTIDRFELVIRPALERTAVEFIIRSFSELESSRSMKVSKLRKLKKPPEGALLISRSKLAFPLTWRRWKKGDRLRPFGMKGFKLVSDVLREKKLNAFAKSESHVLVNGNGDIIWVAGCRSDERYRATEKDNDLLLIQI